MTKKIDVNQMTYEQAFAELEKIVAALESNQSSLDEVMALFERGQQLGQHCNELLNQAELKVRILTGENEEEDVPPEEEI
jgi:exodeoxyribonuclease VII small subunit